MKMWGTQRITDRLNWLQILLVGSFVVVGVAFLTVLNIQSQSIQTTSQLTQFALIAEQANTALLESRRREKDFFLRLDNVYVEQFSEASKKLSNQFSSLKKLAPNSTTRDKVLLAESLSGEYTNAFLQAAQTQIDLGLDENSGKHGEMRQSVRAVENEVLAYNDLLLSNSILTMRRHEKDFIAREDESYIASMKSEISRFGKLLANSKLSTGAKRRISRLIDDYSKTFDAFAENTFQVNNAVEIFRQSAHQTEPLFGEMVTLADDLVNKNTQATQTKQLGITIGYFVILLLVSIITAYTLYRLSKNLTGSLQTLGTTVNEIAAGQYDARSQLNTRDELGEFANAFDNLLEERVATLAKAEKEHDELNNSVVDLLEAVSLLSDKDLTVRATVAEDVTGPVADAMNMMTEETANVLANIREIAQKVEAAATQVKGQGNKVTDVAAQERLVVEQTLAKLEEAAGMMNQIAKVAQSCDSIASRANESTEQALDIVTTTASGMSEVRTTVSETEKRIKRLGERSQEINGIVDIINNIAERTHVLALNASMQAAAAGDAGRGFAVVADEVQRLAESSRQSTSEIGVLVNNIQNETAEAMATMNRTIEQIVNSTELAQKSGEQMQSTQKTTQELTSAVGSIAKHSIAQAKATKALKQDATSIVDSTERTSSELKAQSKQTESLVEFSERLLEAVRVFKLPA